MQEGESFSCFKALKCYNDSGIHHDCYGFITEESEVILSNSKSTKNAKGAGTIRKRADGRWEARYSVGFSPKTGKQIQRSIYGESQKDVRQRLAKITTEIDEGIYTDPCNMKLGTWLDIWLKDYTLNLKPSTRSIYDSHVRTHLKPNLGQIQLGKLAPHMVQHLYNELLNEKGLSPKTIKNLHGALHRAMEQAKRLGYIRTNPLDAVIVPRIEKTKDQPPASVRSEVMKLQCLAGCHLENVHLVLSAYRKNRVRHLHRQSSAWNPDPQHLLLVTLQIVPEAG